MTQQKSSTPPDATEPSGSAVEDELKAWLVKQGYPLEMRMAAALQDQSLFSTLANYYVDPVTGQSRQIDIIAGRDHPTGFLIIELVIECKRSSKRPWLVLSAQHSSDRLGPGQEYALTSGSARVLLSKNLTALPSLPWWSWKKSRGAGIVPAFGDGVDDAFKAVSGAMAASIARRREWMRRSSDALIFIFPIVVVDNDLFECQLSKNGNVHISRIQEAKIYFPMHFGDDVGTCVHVISASYLEEFCKTAGQAINALKRLCEPQAQELLDRLIAERPSAAKP